MGVNVQDQVVIVPNLMLELMKGNSQQAVLLV
jgi:hypothetical protein